jgi:Dyp-type peroxidase family
VTPLELDDIQGDILRAYGNDYDTTAYVFVGFADGAVGRRWLASLLPRVTTATPWTRGKPSVTTNIALTAAGLRALGLSEEALASFAPEFVDGMAARATHLGDVGPSGVEHWHVGGDGRVHGLVTLNTFDAEAVRRETAALLDGMADFGVEVVFEQQAALLRGAREHFGFGDGFSQPAIEGVPGHQPHGGGVPLTGGRWRPLAPGEFILGYPDEDTRSDPKGPLPPAPVSPLGRNGTYLVWRKLYQDVALWRSTLRAAAARYPDGDEHTLAAKAVGRWHNGTPLATHPSAPDPAYDPHAPGANDFRYADDADGFGCPLGAHVRRSNPRDALGFDGQQSFRQRLIRRGMPYGPALPEGVYDDDGADRGLCFVSFQASIARQFEGIQVPWLNHGNIFGLGADADFLLGDCTGRGGKMTVQGTVPFFLGPQKEFVLTRGGDYFFVPGLTALAALARVAQ